MGHHAAECKSAGHKCFKRGKQGHHIAECKSNVQLVTTMVSRVISTQCQKSREEQVVAQVRGRVFSLSGVNLEIR